MGDMFKPPKVRAPAPPPLPPAPPPVPTQAARAETAVKGAAGVTEAAKKRKGRTATLLTGPLGIEEEATTAKKTLLGA